MATLRVKPNRPVELIVILDKTANHPQLLVRIQLFFSIGEGKFLTNQEEFQLTCQRSLPGTGNYWMEGIRICRSDAADRCTGRECRRRY